jgi:hypothetical protein
MVLVIALVFRRGSHQCLSRCAPLNADQIFVIQPPIILIRFGGTCVFEFVSFTPKNLKSRQPFDAAYLKLAKRRAFPLATTDNGLKRVAIGEEIEILSQ